MDIVKRPVSYYNRTIERKKPSRSFPFLCTVENAGRGTQNMFARPVSFNRI